MDIAGELRTAGWWKPIKQFVDEAEVEDLGRRVDEAYENDTVYPDKGDVFNAFRLCPFDQTRVLILGQDPYPGEGHAHGLSFSVPTRVATSDLPPSLRNIFRELIDDVGGSTPESGDLTHWAEQGVLLLNTVLTVRAGERKSHNRLGWNMITDAAIQALAGKEERVVFVLWGDPAHRKARFIDGNRRPHVVLKATHPSRISANRQDAGEQSFFGSKPFSAINEFVTGPKIKWSS